MPRKIARRLNPIPHLTRDAGWIQFSQAQRDALAKYLGDSAIEELRQACELGDFFYRCDLNARGVAEYRDDLRKTRAMILALLDRLNGHDKWIYYGSLAPEETLGQGHERFIRVEQQLRQIADTCETIALRQPKQSARHAPVDQIQFIARVCVPQGIRVSYATNARFKNIVAVCFQAMRIPGDPTRAIRNFLASDRYKSGDWKVTMG